MDPLASLLATLQGTSSGPAAAAAGVGASQSPLISMLSDILGGGGQPDARTATHGVTMPTPHNRQNAQGMPTGPAQPPDGMDAVTYSGPPPAGPQSDLAAWLQRTFGGGRGDPGQPPDGMDAKTYGVTEPLAAQRGPAPVPQMKPGSPAPALAERPIVDGPMSPASQPYTAAPSGAPVGRALSEVLLANGGAAGRPPVPMAPPPGKPEPTVFGMGAKDVGSMIRNALIGAASVDPTRGKFGAFAQGAAGAAKGMRDEQMAQQALDAARADKQFDQGLKLSGENRAIAKDARDARTQNISNTEVVQRIIKGASGELTPDQKLKLEGDVMRFARNINPTGNMLEPELTQRLDRYRNEAEARIRGQAVAPQQGQGGAAKGAAPTAGGDGKTAQTPARPANLAAFEALPKGAFFINPRDGALLQKK